VAEFQLLLRLHGGRHSPSGLNHGLRSVQLDIVAAALRDDQTALRREGGELLILYVSIGAQPVPCSLTKSGIDYDTRAKREPRSLQVGARGDAKWIAHSPSTISRRPNSPRTQCGSQCGWLPSTKSTVISSVPSTP
jgi:hypothetical protein